MYVCICTCVDVCVCMRVCKHLCVCVCTINCSYNIIITVYVHVLQVLTKKQAVAWPPQLLIADTLNTVSPVPADGHTSVCLISTL